MPSGTPDLEKPACIGCIRWASGGRAGISRGHSPRAEGACCGPGLAGGRAGSPAMCCRCVTSLRILAPPRPLLQQVEAAERNPDAGASGQDAHGVPPTHPTDISQRPSIVDPYGGNSPFFEQLPNNVPDCHFVLCPQ